MGDGKDIDRRVARRLTEIFAAAGMKSNRAALELLYLLPDSFLSAYEEVFDRALKLDGSSATGALKDAAELGKAKGGTSATTGKKTQLSGGAGKKYKLYWTVKNDAALELKHSLDKKLRRLAREIRQDLADSDVMAAGGKVEGKCRCGRCGQIMNRDWNFCPGCGQHAPLTIEETKLPRPGRGS
jgi:hypothetical protein